MKPADAPKKVIVVGAGMVGVSTALCLQRDGHQVVLVDREGPAACTSYGNAGILASSAIAPVTEPGLLKKVPKMLFDKNEPLFLKWGYLPKISPWLLKFLGQCNEEDYRKTCEAMFHIIGGSLEEHQAISQGTPAEKYIQPCDWVYVYKDHKIFEKDHLSWSVKKQYGFKYSKMHGDAVRQWDAYISSAQNLLVAMHEQGTISDPGAYVSALAKVFEKRGGAFLKGSIQAFVHNSEGRLSDAVIDGEKVACDNVVIATGAWSKPILKLLGLNVPLETERGYHIELWNPSFVPKQPLMVAAGKFAVTPMDGRLRCAGIVEFGGLEAGPSRAPLEMLERKIKEIYPTLEWDEKTEWLGYRPTVPDSVPMIGELDNKPGVFAAFGHQHVGLTGGPKTGRIIAQLIAGNKPNIDLAHYSPMRFQ